MQENRREILQYMPFLSIINVIEWRHDATAASTFYLEPRNLERNILDFMVFQVVVLLSVQ